MNKICTSLEQSRKLVELGIDVNTADIHYMYRHWEIDENTIGSQSDASIGFDSDFYYGADNGKTYHYIPAWSLSALMELMNCNCYNVSLNCRGAEWNIKFDDSEKYKDFTKDYAVDAAFEMVCWLLENKKRYEKLYRY